MATVLGQHTCLTLLVLCPKGFFHFEHPNSKESALLLLPVLSSYAIPLENLSTLEVNRNPHPVNLMFLLPA